MAGPHPDFSPLPTRSSESECCWRDKDTQGDGRGHRCAGSTPLATPRPEQETPGCTRARRAVWRQTARHGRRSQAQGSRAPRAGHGGCSDGDQNQGRPQLCVSLIFWILVLFSVSLCFIGHLPFPFFCSLWCDFAFLFLVSQAGLTGGGTSLFGGRVWSATTFPLSLALVVARKCFVFIQFRIISPLTSYLVHELFRSVLLIFQAFGDFPETSILLNSMDREQTL